MLVITQDTKQAEAQFLRSVLEGAGVVVVHLDPSVRADMGGAEIGPEAVAQAAGTTIAAIRALGHEGHIHEQMIRGSLGAAHAYIAHTPIHGVLCVGGSMGTALAGALCQSLPYGLPKLIVSTMASGFTAPYMGVKDIAMMNAVTDIAGLNTISRDVFRNAALAVAGMAQGYDPAPAAARPLVLMTTLGTTETCTRRIREALEADGCEVMVFHSSGAGGATLDAIAAERSPALVLDLSVTEIMDRLHGGIAAGAPTRGQAGMSQGVPTIWAPGNADFIIAGPIEVAQVQFPGKRYHKHNPQLTAVRTQLPELEALANHLATITAQAKGPVSLFVPLHGFSSHDSPSGHIHDPSLPAPFADHARAVMPANMAFHTVDAHFNDAPFADAIIAEARHMLAQHHLQSA
ncbi:MAG TPA: Tm-1-like ATP-binding domain-containing protein [Novosphingobium sp.]|nr:Tm-1-like ATP-binding domain-containing protein [Novosphingobium sp.]